MSTNVIGLKGTSEERLGQWRAMLLLREYNRIYKESKVKEPPKDSKLYNYIFKNYIDKGKNT